MSELVASAVFDSRNEAERALSELRSAGIPDTAISIVGRSDDANEWTGRTYDSDEQTHDAKGDVVKGAVIGAGAGALLGVAALAIPGVGPLAAAGAIAASAIPEAAAIGAGAGLAVGSVSGLLAGHGVGEEDAKYYEGHLNQGGIFVSVQTDQAGVSSEQAREILYRNGGHSANRARTDARA
jgi:heat induced stress protein YflT